MRQLCWNERSGIDALERESRLLRRLEPIQQGCFVVNGYEINQLTQSSHVNNLVSGGKGLGIPDLQLNRTCERYRIPWITRLGTLMATKLTTPIP